MNPTSTNYFTPSEFTFTLETDTFIDRPTLNKLLGINSTPVNKHKPIKDYSYTTETTYDDKGNKAELAVTTITFVDGRTVTVKCPKETANQYAGFYACIAKYYMGKKVNNEAEYWIDKLPKKKANEKAKADALKAEQDRIEEKRKQREKEWAIRKAAIKRAEEYKAVKLAEEKYGVPADWNK